MVEAARRQARTANRIHRHTLADAPRSVNWSALASLAKWRCASSATALRAFTDGMRLSARQMYTQPARALTQYTLLGGS